ncbi:MAG: Fe-S cluster assembly protein SufD [Chloroflexi bacterium]|nr:Fe-S cluster assembly protein SufD [Chloroflexota bacterium]
MTQQQPTSSLALGFSRAALDELSRRKGDPDWVRAARQRAWELYQEIPAPTRTDEDWRRTDLSGLNFQEFAPYTAGSPAVATVEALPEAMRTALDLGGTRGGLVAQHNSDNVLATLDPALAAQGVIFMSLDQAARDHADLVQKHLGRAIPADYWKFSALSTAFASGGVFLYVPRGVQIEAPLFSWQWADNDHAATVAHTLVVAERGAKVTLVVQQGSPEAGGEGLHVGALEVLAGEGAQVNYVVVQEWNSHSWDLSAQRTVTERDAHVVGFNAGFGGRTVRVNEEFILEGRGSTGLLYGLYFPAGDQHIDFHTLQDHIAPNTTSNLLFKGALKGDSKAIYEGMVRVRLGAKRTDANQTNKNILMSRTAKADSVPSLWIEDSDIDRCSHGATVGQVDEAQLFYLESRGLNHDEATRLLLEGFFEQVVGFAPDEPVRDRIRAVIAAKL